MTSSRQDKPFSWVSEKVSYADIVKNLEGGVGRRDDNGSEGRSRNGIRESLAPQNKFKKTLKIHLDPNGRRRVEWVLERRVQQPRIPLRLALSKEELGQVKAQSSLKKVVNGSDGVRNEAIRPLALMWVAKGVDKAKKGTEVMGSVLGVVSGEGSDYNSSTHASSKGKEVIQDVDLGPSCSSTKGEMTSHSFFDEEALSSDTSDTETVDNDSLISHFENEEGLLIEQLEREFVEEQKQQNKEAEVPLDGFAVLFGGEGKEATYENVLPSLFNSFSFGSLVVLTAGRSSISGIILVKPSLQATRNSGALFNAWYPYTQNYKLRIVDAALSDVARIGEVTLIESKIYGVGFQSKDLDSGKLIDNARVKDGIYRIEVHKKVTTNNQSFVASALDAASTKDEDVMMEKMVASLIASGASAGAVTDPTAQDPTGKTAASIAANSGHMGLAGYLSEVSLTSHLSSLTLEESELSKGSAALEAELTVSNVSNENLSASEDQISLKDTLAAVRNAAQAAARIQSAFRAHSFRKRREREISAAGINGYGISDIPEISAMSKLAFGNSRDYNSAALSIQKKYRGWKGRKDFLALRQKVVKIQAHVRGYQVRKHYKIICWAVGFFDKAVLRWRRKGAGLRGFRQETQTVDESEDEDILKVFRKQKVDEALEEAVSRVMSMVDSPDARQQYRRMLEKYRQAKAELGSTSQEVALSTLLEDASIMEDDDLYQFT
ncbi:calmodulin-binding transcription activator 4 isoform X1 [Senna tora]|uniref:Calmodulin-binding transcription activator 4 isoform X1 n=1 Tax=Senna tora TaxID=362788 RepID=A0A834X7E7_9FABA|nr:calmodulin-binding transcription activator 4 isoform X1 [Senna tora]